MPRLPRNRWKLESQIRTKATLDAEARYRKSRLGLESSLIRMIDRIDPLELLAVSATTFIVYDTIKNIPELTAAAYQTVFIDIAKYQPLIYFANEIVKLLNGSDFQLTPKQSEQLKTIKETPDLVLFVKSFAIAYILMKHSGQIISGVGNMAGAIGGFFGLTVVP